MAMKSLRHMVEVLTYGINVRMIFITRRYLVHHGKIIENRCSDFFYIKNTSRAIAVKISCHFDINSAAWRITLSLSVLLRRIREHQKVIKWSHKSTEYILQKILYKDSWRNKDRILEFTYVKLRLLF